MNAIWIIITATLVVGAIAALLSRYTTIGRQTKEEEQRAAKADAECCGMHETCEKDSLLTAVSKEIEYYNDYELDQYRGVPCETYDEKAVAAFEEVFYTLRSEEVAGWVRSLCLRDIELPEQIRDEVLLVVTERRIKQ